MSVAGVLLGRFGCLVGVKGVEWAVLEVGWVEQVLDGEIWWLNGRWGV